MPIITSLRLQNLKCLDDTDFISIKPITILVGKNSAGKSTFARSLPLLRQSAEEEKRAPILWYGRLVDFGDFQTALNKNENAESIGFAFKLNLQKTDTRFYYGNIYGSEMAEVQIGQDTEVQISLSLSHDSSTNSTYASSIDIDIFGNKCNLKFSNNTTLSQITINNFVWEPPESIKCVINQKCITPELNFYRLVTRKVGTEDKRMLVRTSPFSQQLINRLSGLAHSNTKVDTFEAIARGLPLNVDSDMLVALQNSPSAPMSFRSKVKRLRIDSKVFQDIKNYRIAASIPYLLDAIDANLAEFLQGVRYIEPLRATAQRYYRRQELAVDEIDSKGTNVAMYVDSLSTTEKDKLNVWLSKYFGVEIAAKSDGGHVALTLKKSNSNQATNLADLGVGFSQILPIVLQLWQAGNPSNKRNRLKRSSKHTCVVIEQPELHLHPAYQATIADIFTGAIVDAKANGRDLRLIAETHSPHLINRLGELISLGVLDHDSVQIVMFEDTPDSDSSTIKISTFTSEGILTNWPFGFFEPE